MGTGKGLLDSLRGREVGYNSSSLVHVSMCMFLKLCVYKSYLHAFMEYICTIIIGHLQAAFYMHMQAMMIAAWGFKMSRG